MKVLDDVGELMSKKIINAKNVIISCMFAFAFPFCHWLTCFMTINVYLFKNIQETMWEF